MLKKITILSLLLLLVTSTVFAQEGTLYENKDYKFRFTHPQGWEPFILKKTKVNGIIVSFSSPDTFASVSIEVSKSPGKRIEELSNEDVRKVVEDSINENRTLFPSMQLKLNSYSVENFKNQKAIKFNTSCPAQFSFPESTDTVYVIFKNSFKYEIGFGGFIPDMEQYQKVLNESLNSFEFLH